MPRPEATDVVYNALQPAIRFTKDQCLDLPDMTYAKREVPLTSQQKKYYDMKSRMVMQAEGKRSPQPTPLW